MKTVKQHQYRIIALLLLAGTIGFLLMLHVTSSGQQRCDREGFDFSLIKLI